LLVAHPKIAMIFTNIVMPGGMNGDELAEAAFAAKPTLKSWSPQAIPVPAVARPSAWLKKPNTAADLAEKSARSLTNSRELSVLLMRSRQPAQRQLATSGMPSPWSQT
jgi:hypothetical protein